MPVFLVPLHEFNPCHSPDGPEGGQFCSTSGPAAAQATDGAAARLVKPGQPFDVVAAVGQESRRFLFNPSTGAFALGGKNSMGQNHAELLADAMGAKPSVQWYDRYTVHGWVGPGPTPGSFEAIVTRVVHTDEVDQIDQTFKFASWLVRKKAPADTVWSVGFGPTPLRTAFPELFRPPRAARRARKPSVRRSE